MTLHTTTIPLAAAEIVSAVAFAVIAYRIYKASRLLESERLLYHCIGFTLLALSQALMTLAVTVGDPRLQVSLYTASSVTAIGGLYAVNPRRGQGEPGIMPVAGVTGVKTVIILADSLAGIQGLITAGNTTGPARLLLAGIGVSYLVRALSVILPLLGAGGSAGYILIAGEALRALSAAVLAALYALGGRQGAA